MEEGVREAHPDTERVQGRGTVQSLWGGVFPGEALESVQTLPGTAPSKGALGISAAAIGPVNYLEALLLSY